MSELDLSQVDEGQRIEDMFLEEAEQVSRTRKAADAGQTLILRNSERDPASAVIEVDQEDTEGRKQMAIAEQEDQVFNALETLLKDRLRAGDTETSQQSIQEYKEEVDKRSRSSESPTRVEEAVVDNLVRNAPIDINEEAQKQSVVRLALANDLREILDKQGILDKVADYSGFLVPFGEAKDISDVDVSSLDWASATNVEQLVFEFQALPAERKLAVWPELVETVLDATGTRIAGFEASEANVQKAAGILMRFLDPRGEAAIKGQFILDVAFGTLDVAGINALRKLPGHIMQRVLRRSNAAHMAASAGDTQRAADATIAASQSEAVAEAVGMSRATAAMNALPLNRAAFAPEQVEGLAPAIVTRLNEFARDAQGLTRNFLEDADLLRSGALNRFEKQRYIESWEQGLETRVSDVFNEEVHVSNIDVLGTTDDGFTARYTITRGEEPLHVRERVTFTTDKNGNFNYTADNSSDAARLVGSPAYWSFTKREGADFNDSFKTAGVTTDAAAAFQNKLQVLVDEAFKPATNIDDVQAVLMRGDEHINPNGSVGRVYQPHELSAGVDVGNRRVFLTDPGDVEAYYRARGVADQFWILENHSARRRLELNGFFNSAQIGDDIEAPVRLIDSVDSAKQSIRNRSDRTGNTAYDLQTGQFVELTDETIDAIYDSNSLVARTSNDVPVRNLDGTVEHVDYVVGLRRDFGSLPQQVAHYKHGYIPRINQGVEYLVKELVPITKRGARVANKEKTVRFFSSKADADKFREQYAREAARSGRYTTIEEALQKISRVSDQELTPMQRVHEAIGASGGLYSGPRASEAILTGLSGAPTERMGVYEALSRNARHTGSLLARNEVRIGDEQRWLNTVESMGFQNNGFEGTTLPTTTRLGRTLERMREEIRAWNGIPVNDETAFQGLMQHMHDWVLEGARKVPGLQNKESVKSLLWLKHADPASAAKSAVMHAVLGLLYPVQYFVQASAASVALSRFPALGPRALSYAYKLGVTDNILNKRSLSSVSRRLGSIDDTTPLFDEIRVAWEKSGLRESVRTNADLDVSNKYGILTAERMKSLSDASLLFYRHGELFNRRFSFTASYLDWKRNNPGKIPTKDDLLDIRKDSNLSMLELNAANRAMWQGGPNTSTMRQIMGVMTQFGQVSAKSIELLIKGEARGGFSTTEKMRILGMQTALFGAAGIPLGGLVANEAAQWTGAEMDQDTINLWNQGVFIGGLLNALDADVDVANRVTAFGQISQFIKDVMFDDQPLLTKMFGIFGDTTSRTWTVLKRIQPLLVGAQYHDGISTTELEIALRTLGEGGPASGVRSLTKAWIMHNAHVIRDRHGNPIDVDDYNTATEIGVALGFRPSIESETRIMQMADKDHTEIARSVADTYVTLANIYNDATRTGDEDQIADAAVQLQATMKFLAASYANRPDLYKRVTTAIQNKLSNPATLREKQLKKFIERQLPEDVWNAAQADREAWFGLPNVFNDTAIVRPFARELEEKE